MKRMQPNNQEPASTTPVHNPFEVLQPGEQVICEIRRHPIGLFGVYGVSAIILAVALVVAFLAPSYLADQVQQIRLGVVLGAVVVMAVTLLYMYVATIVYNANRWIVTSDSITQILQTSLFDKQTSQLSLANLEDVTVDQDGMLQSLFGFGTLHVESAGSGGKFFFTFCPDPDGCARKVIAAHEAYIAEKPEETHVTNRPLATVKSFNQPG